MIGGKSTVTRENKEVTSISMHADGAFMRCDRCSGRFPGGRASPGTGTSTAATNAQRAVRRKGSACSPPRLRWSGSGLRWAGAAAKRRR